MKRCLRYLFILVTLSILEGVVFTSVEAQLPFNPIYPGYNSALFQNYGMGYPFGNFSTGLGMANPWLTGFSGGNFLYSPFLNSYNPYLMEIMNTFNYLQYAIRFYEMAANIPLFYLRDVQADQIGALMYTYADSLGVSPEEAALYFIKENYLN